MKNSIQVIIPITIRAIYQSEKGNVIHDMWLTSVRGRRTEVAYRRRDRIPESTKGSEGHTRPFDTFDIITI